MVRSGSPAGRRKESETALIDAHIHLDQIADLPQRIPEWQAAGVTGVVAAATGLASSRRTLELCRQHPGFAHACAGYHPETLTPDLEEVAAVCAFARAHRDELVGIGEVGLPWYCLDGLDEGRRAAVVQQHEEILRTFCRLAVELGKPLVLHAVHAMAARAVAILQAEGVGEALFHWFKAPLADLPQVLRQPGYLVSFTPEVAHRERDRTLARATPPEHLALESDGPWPQGGRPGDPTMLAGSARAIAGLKNFDPAVVAMVAAGNVRRLFRLP